MGELLRRAIEGIGGLSGKQHVAVDVISPAAIEQRRPERWEEVRSGRTEQRDLPWRARLRLARILLRAGRALLR